MPFLGPLVAAVIEGLLWLFKSRIGLFIVSALVWLGINFATIKLVLGPTISLLSGYASAVGTGGAGEYAAYAAGWLGVLQFDKALTMIISAYITVNAVAQGRLFLFKNSGS